jgi:hypothetical protein
LEWRLDEEYSEIDVYQGLRQRSRVVQILKLVVTAVALPPESPDQTEDAAEVSVDSQMLAHVPEEFRNLEPVE